MPSLLPPSSEALVEGVEGSIHYYADSVPTALAAIWFETLLARVPWASERRRMYERDVDVPRLTAGYALDRLRTDGSAARDDTIETTLAQAAAIAARYCGCEFTSVGLNLYRDGNDSVAPHNDRLHSIEEGAPIALLSLGATRRMTITSKAAPRRRLHLELEAGSLLVMSHATQLHFDHGIPKSRVPVGPRISLAFRRRPRPAHEQGMPASSGDRSVS